MKMKILLASNNGGKIERFKKLLKQVDPEIELCSPKDLGIEDIDVAEDAPTLAGNAELKVRAYADKVDIPILANDTGFYVEGEGLVEAPKRIALGGENENDLSKEEIAQKLLEFWKSIATKYGGEVDAAWPEAFAVLYPDGRLETSESRRDVVLTNREFGKAHLQMPVRALYYSKTTNKPAIQHTPEEELLELQPVVEALRSVLGKNK